MNIIFNSLLAQLVKSYNLQNKIHTRYFLSHVVILELFTNERNLVSVSVSWLALRAGWYFGRVALMQMLGHILVTPNDHPWPQTITDRLNCSCCAAVRGWGCDTDEPGGLSIALLYVM